CLRFGWNLREYVDNGLLEIFGFSMLSINDILDIINGYKPSRLVFDSINVLSEFSDGNMRRNAMLRNLLKLIKKQKITTIITTEKTHGMEKKEFDQFDFMGDGVIFMDKSNVKESNMFLITVQKMRGTKIDGEPRVFEMTDKGIEISLDFSPKAFGILDY
ncbi:MAG: RAD55 family ATPase, partial [Candidatus Syntropharchaeia archaeon]